MLWLQESHGQQYQFSFYNLGLALLNHDGATAFGIWFPIYLLYFYAGKLTVLTQELKGVNVPTAGAALLMT